MSAERNLPSAGREFERGFGWTLVLSAAAHVALLGALVLAPGFVLRPQPPLMSYTVDLIDPSKLGGTNLVAGSKGRVAAPPKVEPVKAAPPEPPPEPAKVEPPPPPPPEPKVEPPPPPAKAPEPPKAVADPDAVALERKAEPTPTRVEVAAAVPATFTPVAPTPVPKAEPTKRKPTAAQAKVSPTSAPKVVARATPLATPVEVAAKAAAPPTKPAAKAAAPKPSAKAAAAKSGAKAAAAPPAAGVNPEARDDRIAAAIKRIEQQAGSRGGGSGGGVGEGPGGPISIGPGEGAGGEVRGVAFIMYINRIEAMIKQKWVWGGPDRSLKADIGFAVLPSGEVVDVRTVVSSGDPTYDRSAETAVRAASPLLPPPEEFQTEFATVGFVYTFEPN